MWRSAQNTSRSGALRRQSRPGLVTSAGARERFIEVIARPRNVVVLLAFAVFFGAPALAQDAAGASEVSMSAIDAIVVGLVEGLTEYLPVSSTGHILVAQELLNLNPNDSEDVELALDTYAICIQLGAIFAVVLLYWERIRQMLDGLLGRSEEGRRVLIAVISAFIPTAIIGLALRDVVRDQLFGPPPIAAAWIIGGLGILWFTRSGLGDREGISLGEITVRHALIIGVCQAIALWPGVSRSLVTIIAALLVGLSMAAAIEFAFLLGLVTLTAATVLSGVSDGDQLVDTFGIATPLLGLVVAFVSAVAAVKWMVAWLEEKGLDIFGWYRIAAGVVLVGLIATGVV
jgi:undecaprenyl-diphosphatase